MCSTNHEKPCRQVNNTIHNVLYIWELHSPEVSKGRSKQRCLPFPQTSLYQNNTWHIARNNTYSTVFLNCVDHIFVLKIFYFNRSCVSDVRLSCDKQLTTKHNNRIKFELLKQRKTPRTICGKITLREKWTVEEPLQTFHTVYVSKIKYKILTGDLSIKRFHCKTIHVPINRLILSIWYCDVGSMTKLHQAAARDIVFYLIIWHKNS